MDPFDPCRAGEGVFAAPGEGSPGQEPSTLTRPAKEVEEMNDGQGPPFRGGLMGKRLCGRCQRLKDTVVVNGTWCRECRDETDRLCGHVPDVLPEDVEELEEVDGGKTVRG